MRMFGRDRALGSHARVADGVTSREFLETKPLNHIYRKPLFLKQFDALAHSDNTQFGVMVTHPLANSFQRRADDQDGMARANFGFNSTSQFLRQLMRQMTPGKIFVGRVQRQLIEPSSTGLR